MYMIWRPFGESLVTLDVTITPEVTVTGDVIPIVTPEVTINKQTTYG
jgi:hypothetical protein